MDAERFDSLSRTFSRSGTRRGLLGVLTALPLAGALTALLSEETDAKDRRRRHKQRNQRHSGGGKKNRTGKRKGDEKGKDKCRPESVALSCAGRCAQVTNRCGGQVDCGPCSCGACPICQTCDTATGTCVPNPSTTGQPCGSTGATCGGGGTPGLCGCTPVDPCTAGVCGDATTNCGQNVNCGACAVITSFSGTSRSIDQGGTTPESATLSWSTTNATSCSIDNGVGPVDCTGNTTLTPGPDTATTYTLTAVGASGDAVMAEADVDVQYCHSITSPGGTCLPGNTQFCLSESIRSTDATHAVAACNACYGPNVCTNQGACGGVARPAAGAQHMFAYTGFGGRNGKILIPALCAEPGARWAP